MMSARETSPPPAVLAAVRAPFEAFGGVWTETALLQPLGLLLDLAGEAMRARLIVATGGVEDRALRPDFTIPVALSHIESGAASGRYLYAGDAFRVAPPGSGRPTEFGQIGIEVLGASPDTAADDAAVAALAWAGAKAGGRDDLTLRFGDVSLFHDFLTALGLPEATVERLVRALPSTRHLARELDRAATPTAPDRETGRLAAILADLPEGEAAMMLEELWRLAGIQPVGGRSPAEIVHRLALRAEASRMPPLSEAEAGLIRRYLVISGAPRAVLEQVDGLATEGGGDLQHALQAWTRRLIALDAAGVPAAAMTLTTGFARPFSYYDGVLFEVVSPALGDEAVAAGGRYDGLPERLGGARGAVGCMVRPALAWGGGA